MRIVVCLVVIAIGIGRGVEASELIRYGLGVNWGNFSVADPDGAVGYGSDTFPSGLFVLYISRNTKKFRLWNEVNYRNFRIGGEDKQIGQSIRSIGLSTTLQRGFNFPGITPFVGLGLGAEFNRYANRHTVDDENYIIDKFDDRDHTSLIALMNIGFSSKRTAGFFYGVSANYHSPLDNGIPGYRVNIFLLF